MDSKTKNHDWDVGDRVRKGEPDSPNYAEGTVVAINGDSIRVNWYRRGWTTEAADMLEKLTRPPPTSSVTTYEWILGWSIDPSGQLDDDDREAWRERAEAWLTEHEGASLSIYVRAPLQGEAEGLYRSEGPGPLQILGYSVDLPEEIATLTSAAYDHACDTAPEKVGGAS